ncbi:MAG TPA: ferritin-like protein [Kofleriaceae bacterium]|nr:ferritin-like protein [Kofleriaceae bacterium]
MSLPQEREQLLHRLRTGFLLELGTIPPYMMALLSIRAPHNRVAAELIRTVMVEEMLHMTMVGNVTLSLGGRVAIDADHVPRYPLSLDFEGQRFRDRRFDVDLAPLSSATIDTFMAIEQPDGWGAERQAMATAELEIPGLTIGDFYRQIVQSLESMCREYGERAVFSGDPGHQVSEDYYWSAGGKPIKVVDLETARRAIDVVIDQGEGTTTSIYDGDHRQFGQRAELAHFFRFREIHYGRHYQLTDKPHAPPTGAPFEVDYTQVFPFKPNPRPGDYAAGTPLAQLNRRFNKAYTLMLVQLREAFGGTPRTLYTAIMNGMHGISEIARQMLALPIPGDPDGYHGAPTFEWVEAR